MNSFDSKEVTINKANTNLRLDQALSKIINYSRSQIKILLQNKNVKILNKTITQASYKVKEGEIFTIRIPKIIESKYEPQNIPLNIIYEDKDLLVINKPAGLVTHPAPGNKNDTLVNALIYYTKNSLSSVNDTNRPGIVHRLDKDTSGLLLIAKNNKAHLNLAEQFKNHNISRKYFAIVWGIPNNMNIEVLIGRNKKNRKKMSVVESKGKHSKTSIKLLKSFDICSLIECTLETGRTHQIRVHMDSINHPLVGDKLYGKIKSNKYNKNKKNFNKYLILKNFDRQALHAKTIGFMHPNSKKNLKFNSDLPLDMLNLLEFLAKY